MNGRAMYRAYAQSKGKEAKEFIEIEKDYGGHTLITKDNQGNLERTHLHYEDVVNFMIKKII